MTESYPLPGLDDRIRRLEAGMENHDPLFRMAILTGQVGQMARILYHDQRIFPASKPIPGDEQEAAGDLLIQTLLYISNRGLSIERALEIGLGRMEEKVYSATSMVGAGTAVFAAPGFVEGTLLRWRKSPSTAGILVNHPERKFVIAIAEAYEFEEAAAYLSGIGGFIFRDAGLTSHPATISREHRIPMLTKLSPEEWKAVEEAETDRVRISSATGEAALTKLGPFGGAATPAAILVKGDNWK